MFRLHQSVAYCCQYILGQCTALGPPQTLIDENEMAEPMGLGLGLGGSGGLFPMIQRPDNQHAQQRHHSLVP